MAKRSRDLRGSVVHALTGVGLVWVLAVLGAFFMTMSSQGDRADGGYTADSASAQSLPSPGEAPRTVGLALALVVLAGGVTVLAIGGAKQRPPVNPVRWPEHRSDLVPDLPLALGLVVTGSGPGQGPA